MKYFVFSDVHGCYKELIDALKISGYDEEDKNHYLLCLGDAFDHNDDGHYDMYKFLKENIEQNKLTWIYGNHEDLLLSSLEQMVVKKSTISTIRDIALGLDPNAIRYTDIEYLHVLKRYKVDEFIKKNCLDYFETKDFVFTHGFIPYDRKNNTYDSLWREKNIKSCRSINGQRKVLEGIKIPGKTLVCGHIGAYYGRLMVENPNLDAKAFDTLARKIMANAKKNPKPFEIFYGDGVIAIDSRAYDTGMVNILVVEE